MFEETKSILSSKTIWSGVVAVAAGIAGLFGYHMGADVQGSVVELIAAVGSVVGGVGAVYGRVKADAKVGG